MLYNTVNPSKTTQYKIPTKILCLTTPPLSTCWARCTGAGTCHPHTMPHMVSRITPQKSASYSSLSHDFSRCGCIIVHSSTAMALQTVLCPAHSRGCCSTCSISCSGEPSAGCTDFMYCHLTRGGAETMILSIRPPSNPNRTPLSYSRLNSIYLPRRSSCHSLCASVNGNALRAATMSAHDDTMFLPTS